MASYSDLDDGIQLISVEKYKRANLLSSNSYQYY